MNWKIKFSSRAEKYYKKLSKDNRRRVRRELIKLNEYENPSEHQHVKPLAGELRGFYRLRVGHIRIIFAILTEMQTIAIVNIAPRGDSYKKGG